MLALAACLCATKGSAATSPNIVLITVDSISASRMSFLGGKGASTPNLDRLASNRPHNDKDKDTLVFERAYAQSPDSVRGL